VKGTGDRRAKSRGLPRGVQRKAKINELQTEGGRVRARCGNSAQQQVAEKLEKKKN